MAEKRFLRAIEWIYLVVIALVIAVNVLLDNRYYYVCQNNCVVPNAVFLGVFVVLAGVLFYLSRVKKQTSINGTSRGCDTQSNDFKARKVSLDCTNKVNWRNVMLIIGVLSLILLAIQIFYAYEIYFETGWDCRALVIKAQELAFEGKLIGDEHYFSLYPNNAFLVGIFAGILKLVAAFGINNAPYFPLIIVGCILVTLSGYLMADCVRILTNKKSLVFGFWFVFVFLTGLSPWISIPYSDTYSIIFPVLAIWLMLTKNERNASLRWFFIGLTCFVGYFIKPTVLLTFMVIVAIEVIHFLFLSSGSRMQNRKQTKRESNASEDDIIIEEKPSEIEISKNKNVTTHTEMPNAEGMKMGARGVLMSAVKAVVPAILGIVVALLLRTGMEKLTGFTPDETRQVTPIHYFMMGLNQESGGGYNQADVNMSFSFATVEERNREDFKIATQRIKDMLPTRIITFEAQKMLTNFNDGTFAWGNEGDFYWTYYEKDNFWAKFFRSYVYHIGERHDKYVAFTQGIWFMVLCMCALVVFKSRPKKNYRETIIFLSMLAIMCFLMVFEARARYLYLYSPIIYMSGAIGLNRLITRKDCDEKNID